MPARTHVVKVVLFVLCVSLGVLQSGCGSSAGGGKAEAPADSGSDIHLALSTASGFTAVVADGRSTVPIRIQVTSGTGAGVAGVPVTFATTAGSLSESPIVRASRAISSAEQTAIPRADGSGSVTVNTDANGIAQVILTASTQAQTVVVTADVQGFRTNIVIEFAPGPAARVQLNTSAATVNAAGTATLTATVTDANGNPVPGETVTFTFTTNTSGATLSATSAVTNTNGQATVKYTAGVVPGADTVQAKATSTGVAGSTSLTVPDITSSAAVKSIAVIAGATSVVADGATPVAIRATVAVASGSPAGILVSFTTTAGSLSPATIRTDANGVATVNLIAATSLGTATVTAAAGGFSATTTVDFVAGAPAVLRLTATPTTVNTRANATITANVTDANGNPVKEQTLTFSLPTNASGATLSASSGATDASGQFTLTYRAGATAGTDTVQARTANGIVGTVTLTVSTAVSNVSAIAVVAGAANVVADGTTPVAIRATVTVTAGSRAGILVSFATTAGSLPAATATTDADGMATVSLIAATSLGTATVTAAAGGFSATVTVSFVAGAPDKVLLSANPPTVNAQANSTITATVRDANGNPVQGHTLTFRFLPDPPPSGAATLSASNGVTDANGQVTLTYTAGATAGIDTVQAQTTNGKTGTVAITVASAPAGNVTAITVVAGASRVAAGDPTPVAIRATVTVSSGSKSGITVTFTTTAGTLSSATATTDANGVATVNLLAATILGTATVTASAGGFSATATVSFVAGAPAEVLLSANPPTVNAQANSTITATVRDANGNPVQGHTLTFRFLPDPPPSGAATLSASNGVTDANGQVTLTYTAGATAGIDTVQAQTTNGITRPVSITVTSSPAGSVASITLAVTESSGTPNDNIIAADGSATATVTATLLDTAGTPVGNGVVVNFTTTLGSITGQATTTGAGRATATFTAGTVAGNATVRATAGTVTSAPVVITLTAGPVNSLTLVNISNTTIGVRGSGTNETSNLSFEARDSNGNLVQDPVPGVPGSGTAVSFTLENGGLGGGESLSPLRATAVNGRVTTTLQSGTEAGTVRVIAFIDTNGNGFPDGTEITSQAIGIVITGGPPWGENLSVAVAPLNIAGLVTFGLTDTITTFLSDRFSNPVPDGTAVFFSSDFAGVTGSAVSSSGTPPGSTASTAAATLTSQGPLPPDGFVTVTPSTLSGSDARVLSLAVNPANANLVYAGTDGGGVFRTTNGLNPTAAQVSWAQVGRAQTGLTNGIVRDLQIDPTNTSIIYAATDTGVFRSTGSGDNWAERSGRERITGEVLGTIAGAVPGTIPTVSTLFTLAFPSDSNRAKTVVRITSAATSVVTITTLYVFAGAQAIELLPSADGLVGDTVSIDYDLGAVIGAARVTAIALDPTPLATDPFTTRTLYAGTQGAGVFRSDDSGFSWTGINNGLSDPNVLSLVVLSPTTPTTLYAGTFGGGVFRTVNATDAIPVWSRVSNGLTSTVVNTLATDGTTPTPRVYAGTFLGGVFFLTDGTVAAPTWIAPTTNVNTIDILNGFVSDIVIDPNNPAILYAATLGDGTRSIEGNSAEGGVFRSTDSGVTWTRIPPLPATQLALPPADLPNNRVSSLGIAADPPDALYVGVAGRNMVRHTPSTATYTVINGTPPNQFTNNIFVSGTVLFSGNTRITITELGDLFQDQDREAFPDGFGPLPDSEIFNLGSQSFVYTVSDQNGNPITGGSTVTVTASAGLVTGDTSITIPDTQRGSTVFGVAWQNNRTEVGNIGATLNVSATSAPNGSVSAGISRTLIGPVTISPSSATLSSGGGSVTFSVSGGSETLLSQGPLGGGYSITTTAGTVAPNPINFPGSFVLTKGATTTAVTITVTVTDRITGQRATATVTQEAPAG